MSRWLVGSSRRRKLASPTSRVSSRSRLRSPPDSISTRFSTSSGPNWKRPRSLRACSSSWPTKGSTVSRARVRLSELAALLGVVGDARVVAEVRGAYYSQQGRELTETDTCLETVLPLVGHDEEQARKLLGRFQFGPDEVEKRVEMLSGGER